MIRRDEEQLLRNVLRMDTSGKRNPQGKGIKDERKQDGKTVLTRHENYWTESGRGDGQGDRE